MHRHSFFLYSFVYFQPHWSLLPCVGPFSSCGEQGRPWRRCGSSLCSAGLPLLRTGSNSRAHRLSGWSSQALKCRLGSWSSQAWLLCGLESSQARDWTCVPCIAGGFLTYHISGEVPHSCRYRFFSTLVYHRILNMLPHSAAEEDCLLFHPVCNSLHVLTPNSQSFPPSEMLELGFPAPASLSTHKSLFCKLGEFLSLLLLNCGVGEDSWESLGL